ncbi:MAG: hypothetical protein MUE78_01185 [Ilumatobacteraceae bacterium]|nr:hypothetical protein [Ilumatobacteraceae bacterium]
MTERSQRWSTDDRTLDLLAVVLMSMTAILTAWTGFQSAKWGGVMAIAFSQAGAARTEAVLLSDVSGVQLDTDLTLATAWTDALAAGDTDLAAVHRELFSPTLEAATQAWEAAEDPPGSPLAMPEYTNAGFEQVQPLLEQADERAAFALVANQRSDNYVIISVLSASVLFFAALSTKLRERRLQIAMLAMAFIGFVVAIVIVSTFPIEV